MTENSSTPMEDPIRQVLHQAYESWQSIQPEPLVRNVHLCALPLRADRQLLEKLVGEAQLEKVSFVLEAVEFAEWQDDMLQFHPYLRSSMLENWLVESPDLFKKANQAVLDYYTQLRDNSPEFTRPILQREVIYHCFLDDEMTGLDQFRKVCENLLDRRLLGTVQEVIEAVNEITQWLSTPTRQWVRFYSALLVWEYGHRKKATGTFETLKEENLPVVLEALVNGQLAELMVSNGQWAEAIRQLFENREVLQKAGADRDSAQMTLALGRAYQDLAEHSGGYRPIRPIHRSRLNRFLELLNNLPFILYRWLIRRVGFLWSPLTHSPHFQDWIVAYLMVLAARQFKQAHRVFSSLGDYHNIVQTDLARARLELAKGRWSRADKLYHSLKERYEVLFSPYRTALVQQGLGTLSYVRRNYSSAEEALKLAREIFNQTKDTEREIQTGSILGRAQYRQGKTRAAVETMLDTLKTEESTEENLLSATSIIWSLEEILNQLDEISKTGLKKDLKQRIHERLKGVTQRAYLTRFAVNLLPRFRRIALIVALPLSFPLAALLGFVFILSVVTISESLVNFIVNDIVRLRLQDYLVLFLGVILPGPVALWLYRFVYTRIGAFYVRSLGKEIDPIQGDQPEVVETNAEGIRIDIQSQDKVKKVLWEAIQDVQWVCYSIWRQPIWLLSTLYLRVHAKTDTITLQGITDGFENLKQDVYEHLSESARRTSFDFSFLRNRVVTVVSILALLVAILFTLFIGPVNITAQPENGEERILIFSSVLATWLFLLLFIMPALTMVRLVSFRRILMREMEDIYHSIPMWALYLATITSFLFALTGMVVLVLLSQAETEISAAQFLDRLLLF